MLFFNLALKTVNTDTDTFYANYIMNGASSRAILAHRLYQLVTLCPTNSNFVLYFVPNFCLYNFLRFFPTMDKTEVNFFKKSFEAKKKRSEGACEGADDNPPLKARPEPPSERGLSWTRGGRTSTC